MVKWNRNYENIECGTCGCNFEAPTWRKAKFCSNKCANIRPNSSRFKKGYKETESIKKKRLKSIKENTPKGAFHWNYIDGRSEIMTPRRYGDDWESIRYLVYLRDGFECQHCGKNPKENKMALDVHHKKPFLKSFDNSLSNLTTLCRSCHMKEESRIKFKEGGKIMKIKND